MLNEQPFKNYFEKKKEEYSEYLKSKHWQDLRKEKLEQVDYKCQICGSHYGLQVHHKHYDNLGSESIWDLRVLCEECHAGTHDDLAEQREWEYLKRKERENEKPLLSVTNIIFIGIFISFAILTLYLLITRNWLGAVTFFILLHILGRVFKH